MVYVIFLLNNLKQCFSILSFEFKCLHIFHLLACNVLILIEHPQLVLLLVEFLNRILLQLRILSLFGFLFLDLGYLFFPNRLLDYSLSKLFLFTRFIWSWFPHGDHQYKHPSLFEFVVLPNPLNHYLLYLSLVDIALNYFLQYFQSKVICLLTLKLTDFCLDHYLVSNQIKCSFSTASRIIFDFWKYLLKKFTFLRLW